MTRSGGRASGDGKHGHVVDYRHVIHSLRNKPMAPMSPVHRDQIFLREAYRQTFDRLVEELPEQAACKIMVELLSLVHERACEAELADVLAAELKARRLPELSRLQTRFSADSASLPSVSVDLPSLAVYNDLLTGAAA